MSQQDLELPLSKMHQWIEKEKELGSVNPSRIVLATASSENIPHSRTVAIREMTSEGLLFFTQRGTKKVAELQQNARASMTLWLALQQRQVVLDGKVVLLTEEENEKFWKTISREQQLRFSTYAPTSGKVIACPSLLEKRLKELSAQYGNGPIPKSEDYCGFHFIADSISFYTLGVDTFSEVIKYQKHKTSWEKQYLSP